MPKSKDAFRTISEVAEWLDTPAHVLRFWESKFTQVKPVKRAGGRRYYRPADMLLLGGIKKLLHDDGLTIKGAQKLLREHGVKHVAALSQPLDEDLIEEAAYELDAQPEPMVEAPATVLSFPQRTETASAAEDEPVPAQESAIAASATEQAAKTVETEETAANKTQDDASAFGTDALPAFLRRASPSAQHTQDVDKAPAASEQDVASSRDSSLTIDPVARFEPIEAAQNDSAETTLDVPSEAETNVPVAPATEPPAPEAPVFSHHRSAEAPAKADPPQSAQTGTEAAAAAEDEPEAKPATRAPAIDVPSLAKIAPTLESYSSSPGILSALPGTRRISPELAHELSGALDQLRALRDRMRSH